MSIRQNNDIEKSIVIYRFFRGMLKVCEDDSLSTTLQLKSILPQESFEKLEKFIKFSVMKQANDLYYNCKFNEFINQNFN